LPVDPTERYEMAGVHGRGGLGRVVKARDRRLGRTVAIKELLRRTSTSEARFVREALITARLEHPGIVPVHEAGRWPSGDPYYSMKLVSGRTLKEVIGDRPDFEGRLALLPHVIAIAEAVGYAHSKGVIHRDIKPANVVLGEFGETVLVDWGLAKDLSGAGGGELDGVVEGLTDLASGAHPVDDGSDSGSAGGGGGANGGTALGKVMGTPAYMAPEQARGEEVDARADVFSLGALLYEVLAGEPPYQGDSSDAILARAVAGPVPAVEASQPGAPPDLCAIVRKATAATPADRYPSGKELAEDLKRFQTGQLVTARSYPTRTLVWRWALRHRALVTAAVAALLAATIASVIGIDRVIDERNQAERARGDAVRSARAAVSRSEELILQQALSSLPRDPTAAVAWLKDYPLHEPERVATMLDEARAAGVARHVWRHKAWLYGVAIVPGGLVATADMTGTVMLYRIDDGVGRELGRHVDPRGNPLGVHELVASPDGKTLATKDGSGTIYLWDLAGGGHKVVAGDYEWAEMMVWSRDARRLLFVDGNETTHVVDAATGAVPHDLARGFFGAGFTPDGAAVIGVDRMGDIRRVPLDGGPATKLAHLPAPAAYIARSPDERRWLVMGRDEVNRLVDLTTGRVTELGRQPNAFAIAAFSPSGRLVATGGTDTTIRVYDVATGVERVLRGHEDSIYHVLFTADEERLVSASDDATIRVWDLRSGETHVLRGHEDDVVQLALSPDGDWLASAGLDGSARLWSMRQDDGHLLVGKVRGEIRDFVFGDDGQLTLVNGRGGRVERWDLAAGTSRELPVPLDPTNQTVPAMSKDGRWAATARFTAQRQAEPYLVDLTTGSSIPLPHPPMDLRTVRGEFSPDSKRIVGIDAVGNLIVVDAPSHTLILSLKTKARLGAFSPDSARLALAGRGTLAIHDATTGAPIATAALDHGACAFGHPSMVVWSPDGRFVAASSKLGCTILWDVAKDRVRSLAIGTANVVRFAFSPDGKWLAAASSDRKARVWSTTSEAHRVLGGHTDVLLSVAFSPDSRMLATASYDKTVRLWQLDGWRSRVLRGHAASVDAVGFLPGGRKLVSAARDGTLRIWDVADTAPASAAELRERMAELTSTVIDGDARPTTRRGAALSP
jgi:WD40 repeat protein/tRNA A-37 threonylcarbamoyl transferase component Bud32